MANFLLTFGSFEKNQDWVNSMKEIIESKERALKVPYF